MVESINDFYIEHQAGRDLRVHDPALNYVYGFDANHGPGAVFYDALTSSAGLRSLDITQLSKSQKEAPIPNMEQLKRAQHLAGKLETLAYFGREGAGSKKRLSEEEIAIFGLVAIYGDLAHGTKSHITDIMIEGAGGAEDFHDRRAHQVVDNGGLQEVLDKHRLKIPRDDKGLFDVELPLWVESPEGVCLDRLNYVAAEAQIWFPNNSFIAEITDNKNIEIDDNQRMVFRDQDVARAWAKTANLLSSEHWNDPTSRLIELISSQVIQRIIFERYLPNMDSLDNGFQGLPENYTFFCDSDFEQAFERKAADTVDPDHFLLVAKQLLNHLGEVERGRFEYSKRDIYEQFIRNPDAEEYPSELVNPHIANFGIGSGFVQILDKNTVKQAVEKTTGKGDLYIEEHEPIAVLKQLKKRQFDPLVKTKKGSKPLSQLDKKGNKKIFKEILSQHAEALDHVAAIKLIFNPEMAETFEMAVKDNHRRLSESKSSEMHLSPDQLRKVIKNAGARALDRSIELGVWKEM